MIQCNAQSGGALGITALFFAILAYSEAPLCRVTQDRAVRPLRQPSEPYFEAQNTPEL